MTGLGGCGPLPSGHPAPGAQPPVRAGYRGSGQAPLHGTLANCPQPLWVCPPALWWDVLQCAATLHLESPARLPGPGRTLCQQGGHLPYKWGSEAWATCPECEGLPA